MSLMMEVHNPHMMYCQKFKLTKTNLQRNLNTDDLKELLFNHFIDIKIMFLKGSYLLVEWFSNLNVHHQQDS